MIFGSASKEKVFEWREIHKQFKDKLTPNRKSGKQVLEYLLNKYLLDEFNEEKGFRAVAETVLNNDFLKQKLPPNSQNTPTLKPTAWLLWRLKLWQSSLRLTE